MEEILETECMGSFSVVYLSDLFKYYGNLASGVLFSVCHEPDSEYVLSIHKRIIHRPLVIEEERLNFEGDKNNG